ncbi:hypothetical protein [Streptomyces sp. 8K308]|nr:hypothetical protein [Streptomyces sp. 8K308]
MRALDCPNALARRIGVWGSAAFTAVLAEAAKVSAEELRRGPR